MVTLVPTTKTGKVLSNCFGSRGHVEGLLWRGFERLLGWWIERLLGWGTEWRSGILIKGWSVIWVERGLLSLVISLVGRGISLERSSRVVGSESIPSERGFYQILKLRVVVNKLNILSPVTWGSYV